MKTLILTSAAALLAASTAMAQEVHPWDTNQDEYIDRAEYDEQIQRRQARGLAGEQEATGWWFDSESDDMITREEIEVGTGEMDADEDGVITRDEYDEYMWRRYDADQDDRWSADEARHFKGGSDVSQ